MFGPWEHPRFRLGRGRRVERLGTPSAVPMPRRSPAAPLTFNDETAVPIKAAPVVAVKLLVCERPAVVLADQGRGLERFAGDKSSVLPARPLRD